MNIDLKKKLKYNIEAESKLSPHSGKIDANKKVLLSLFWQSSHFIDSPHFYYSFYEKNSRKS